MSNDNSGKTYKIVKKFDRTKRLEGILEASKENNKTTYSPVSHIPSTNNILHDILQTVARQAERLKIKSVTGYSLESDEMKQLQQCNEIVLKIKADERAEVSQADVKAKLDSMSDEQLLEYVQEVMQITSGSKEGAK